jgi:hypothetical protein
VFNSGRAKWVVRPGENGVKEVAGFFTVEGEWIFAYAHVPEGEPRGVVVVCPPILAEALVVSRRDRLLAEALVDDGWATFRFHYRGSGHSGGSAELCTLDSLVTDAKAAIDACAAVAGHPVDSLIGTRVGGTVAALAARSSQIGALALVAPVIDARAYFREIFRSHALSELKSGAVETVGRRRAEIDGGPKDVLGYPLSRQLRDSTCAQPVEPLLSPPLRSLLLVQLGDEKSERRRVDEVALRANDAGTSCDVVMTPSSIPWWFGGGAFRRSEDEVTHAHTIDALRSWLVSESAHAQ